MSSIFIEGGKPLMGAINVSGAKNSALKLLPAALFSNEDIILENVPHVASILNDIEVVKSLGVSIEWTGANRLHINAAPLDKYEISYELGSKSRTSLLLAGPLLYRFGKAVIPKFDSGDFKSSPINRFLDTWKSLGITVEEDEHYLRLSIADLHPGTIKFTTSSHMATDNAVLSSVFIEGKTTITNASEECEIDDLVEMLNLMGAKVVRTEPRKIEIEGSNIFKSTRFKVQPDKTESALFATAAVLTKGNVLLKGINKEPLIPFVNFLNKIEGRFDFNGTELKVWRHEDVLKSTDVTVSATPGFVPDWQSLATVILTQAEGTGHVHDTVYINNFDYTKDLNRMGAKIELIHPSDINQIPVISDDSYDFSVLGEPKTVARIQGPSKLRGERLFVSDIRNSPALVLAALCAEGKSEIIGIETVERYFEDFTQKLISLGANIWEQ